MDNIRLIRSQSPNLSNYLIFSQLHKFKQVIEDIQKNMKNGRMIGHKSHEAGDAKPEELKPLSEMFKAAPGTWECTTCYIRNKQDASVCVSCETPKPGSQPKSNGKTVFSKLRGPIFVDDLRLKRQCRYEKIKRESFSDKIFFKKIY